MISTNLTGNFGNNISQLTVCRVIAEKLGYEWGVNPNPTHDYYNGRNQLDFMDVDFGKQPQGIINQFHEKWIIHNNVNIAVHDKNIYNIKDNTILLGHNGAKGGIYQSEDYFIDRKSDIIKWYQFKPECVESYKDKLKELNIVLDDNLCVINFRGGEYRGVYNLILRKEYWRDATNHMLSINPNMKFLLITDDIECANSYMPFPIQAIHIDIGFDYYVVNQAKWLILSNSSFGLWAAWLNEKTNKTIAPRYWSQHNTSNGYWGIGDQYNRCFTYLDRDSKLVDYDTCKAEAIYFYKMNGILQL
jgi:hypothetical protein